VLDHEPKISPRNPTSGRWRWLAALGLSGGLALTAAPTEAAWTAAIRPDPLARQSRCLLVSEPQTTSDGYDSTPVSLVFNGTSLLVITESELDASFADLALVVDAEPPVRSDALAHNRMFLVFDQDIPSLVQKFRAGRQVTVYLRFWPTWPATRSFPVSFSLAGFSKAHDRFTQGCQPAG
jgi:hypothetical protein